tara:strand:- start:1676 stop:4042 length:2367 start_codon:yes stop_codon:yes gene_type:complete
MNEVEIPIKVSGLGAIKAELRALKGEIANATDPADIARLSQAAGELSDKIKDANESVAVFASGSKFEQVSNGLGGIKDSLMSLDFEEAATKAKTFATVLKGTDPKALVSGIGALMKVMGSLGSLMLKLGAQLLANPYFLLAVVIIAIVVAVVLLMKKFGVLQTVIDALMMPLNMLIAGFEMLTDWMGLTDNAGEERAQNEMARMDREAAAGEARMKRLDEANKSEMGDYDRKIALAKAEGKSTVELQRAKIKGSIAYQTQVIAESQLKLKQIYLNLQELQTLNIEDEEKRKRQEAGNKAMADARALITSMGEARRNSFNELKILDLDEIKTQKEKVAAGKKGTKDNKNNLKEQLNDIKEFNADKEKLDAMTIQSTLNLMASGMEKEKAIREQAFVDYQKTFIDERLKKEIEGLDKQFLAKKLTEDQYNAKLAELRLTATTKLSAEELLILKNAETLKNTEIQTIKDTYAQNLINGDQMIADAKFAAMEEGAEKELLAQAAQYEKLRADALANTTLTEEQKKALIAVYNEQEKAQIATQLAEKKKTQEDLLLTLQDEATQLREAENAQFLLDVEAANGNYETLELLKKAHEDKLLNIETEANNAKVAEAQKERDAKLGFAKDTVDGLTNLGGMLIKDQKKLEKFNKASALIQIGIDTAKAISALVAASNTNPLNAVTAGGAGIAQFAAGIIQIATNVAKAKQILSSPGSTPSAGGGGGGSESGGGGGTSAATALPQAAQLFGSANTGGTMSAGGSSSESGNMTVTAIVSETQVTSTQQKINRINKSAEL